MGFTDPKGGHVIWQKTRQESTMGDLPGKEGDISGFTPVKLPAQIENSEIRKFRNCENFSVPQLPRAGCFSRHFPGCLRLRAIQSIGFYAPKGERRNPTDDMTGQD